MAPPFTLMPCNADIPVGTGHHQSLSRLESRRCVLDCNADSLVCRIADCLGGKAQGTIPPAQVRHPSAVALVKAEPAIQQAGHLSAIGLAKVEPALRLSQVLGAFPHFVSHLIAHSVVSSRRFAICYA